jgi:hypothetical protein
MMKLSMRTLFVVTAVLATLTSAAATVAAQSVRDHTRLTPNRSTAVTEKQANELTLTLTEVAVRPIQVWIRTAGVIDEARRTVTAELTAAQAARVKVGQRVRAFSPQSRSRMYQANVAQVAARAGGARVMATLQGQALETDRHYVLEIVADDGDFLSVPNEALLESGGRRFVYVLGADGGYTPRDVTVGMQGELFTQVLGGLRPGEKVVTIGSFFIDADQKLKGP